MIIHDSQPNITSQIDAHGSFHSYFTALRSGWRPPRSTAVTAVEGTTRNITVGSSKTHFCVSFYIHSKPIQHLSSFGALTTNIHDTIA